ncbi:GTPase-activating protein [Pestalotiopsis sp. 9143b]|nr:GTPase-activating protein [Pestalotiopsis sp. 9143b]
MADHAQPQSVEAHHEVDDSHVASDKETDTFEDAVDASSVRSLTASKSIVSQTAARPTSSGSDSTVEKDDADEFKEPAESITERDDSDTESEVELHDATEAKVEVKSEPVAEPVPETKVEAVAEPEKEKETESESVPAPEKKTEVEPVPEPELGKETETVAEIESKAEPDVRPASRATTASSRVSHSNMDVVSLDDDPPTDAAQEKEVAPPVPPKQVSKKLSLSNIANSLPAMPWSPPATESPPKTSPSSGPPVPEKPPAPDRTSTSRSKLSSPFSWLSRSSTSKEPVVSPPSGPVRSPRRDTASSVATLTSNPEMLGKLDEGDEGVPGRPARHSLKDRFKMVRMREEAGISFEVDLEDDKDQASAATAKAASVLGIKSPIEGPTSPLPTDADLELRPGTASGVSAGPADADAQVDWDLWQSVVYEGPSAVAKTSPEELNKAIATGIPTVIRGVVWQVLAQSKNEDLEQVYRELAARGTERDVSRDSAGTSISSLSNGLSIDKGTVASSSSSVHSDEVAGANGSKSPPSEKETEAILKAQALAATERKKKDKEDAAMISKLEKTIRRDLGSRTSYSKHAQAAGLQEGLFGVCKAYALFDESVGYAQGMNFLIMPLLFSMPEDEAFCLLVRLMNHYKLRDLFVENMPGLHMHLFLFERLLEDHEPAVYCHLNRRGISPHLYATQWFLTLFAYRFPLQLVMRIYDLILSEGLSALLKFGIVLMQKNASTLLGMTDMAQLTVFLRDRLFDVYIDQAPSSGSILENGFFGSSSSSIDKEVYRADQLVRDACDIKITPELLKAYTTEWEEKTRAEKQREEEMEHLKQSNTSYAIRVRKLEERLQSTDTESTNMANELVHTKIENEELKDENESLKGQVKELRNVIEKQPLELENAWKEERDSLMKRNEKVHEENQKVEKEMSELEEELVQTKMRYAEINSQYETLQRKWADLKKQFN